MTNAFAIPFPWIPGDAPVGDSEFQARVQQNFDALAIAVGPVAQNQPRRVTSLPAVPFDAQEVYYVADATNAIVWHLKYRSAATGSYKWEYVGGAPLFSEATDSVNTASTAYASVGTAVGFTLPLAGDYDIDVGGVLYSGSDAVNMYLSYSIGGTAAADIDGIRRQQSGAGYYAGFLSRTRRKTGLAASTALLVNAKVGNLTGNFEYRQLSATPVRVG
jgi:hypothetical protein